MILQIFLLLITGFMTRAENQLIFLAESLHELKKNTTNTPWYLNDFNPEDQNKIMQRINTGKLATPTTMKPSDSNTEYSEKLRLLYDLVGTAETSGGWQWLSFDGDLPSSVTNGIFSAIPPKKGSETSVEKDLGKPLPTKDRLNIIKNIPSKYKNELAEMIKLYKIHLMPDLSCGRKTFFLLAYHIYTNQSLKKLVHEIKMYDDLNKYPQSFAQRKMPFIVIYAAGKDTAQSILNSVYELFKNNKTIMGTGNAPRFNRKITDLIFYAQGNGDDKSIYLYYLNLYIENDSWIQKYNNRGVLESKWPDFLKIGQEKKLLFDFTNNDDLFFVHYAPYIGNLPHDGNKNPHALINPHK